MASTANHRAKSTGCSGCGRGKPRRFGGRTPGSREAPGEWLEKLPAGFGPAGPGWLALRIRDEGADPEALARQFELFKIAEQEKRDKVLRQARLLRFVGTFIAILLFASVFLLLFWVFKRRTR